MRVPDHQRFQMEPAVRHKHESVPSSGNLGDVQPRTSPRGQGQLLRHLLLILLREQHASSLHTSSELDRARQSQFLRLRISDAVTDALP